MERLWFSLCLLRLKQRNEVCEFEESFEITVTVLQGVLALSYSPLCCIFKGDCMYIIRIPLKQLARSHLFNIWPLQASSCSKAFNSATKATTSTVFMRGCRKMAFSMRSKYLQLHWQLDLLFAPRCYDRNVCKELRYFVISYTICTSITIMHDVSSNWSSSSAYNIV